MCEQSSLEAEQQRLQAIFLVMMFGLELLACGLQGVSGTETGGRPFSCPCMDLKSECRPSPVCSSLWSEYFWVHFKPLSHSGGGSLHLDQTLGIVVLRSI